MLSTRQLSADDLALKERLKKTGLKYTVILCIGVAYFIFFQCTGVGIPCPFHKITGLKCPGCGVSRMIVSILRLDLAAAFKYNPFLFITVPFLIAYLVCSEIKYVLQGSGRMGKWETLLYVELVLAIAYWILRNIFPI